METITFAMARSAARKVIGEVGEDFLFAIGDGCTYVTCDYNPESDDYEPMRSVCIVGKIFEALGVPLDVMDGKASLNHCREEFANGGVVMTDKAFLFLDTAQGFQDTGMAWSAAAETANAVVSRRNWNFRTEGLISLEQG